MLEHQKIVLSGVADDATLFRKELQKSISWLDPQEIIQLRKWLMKKELSPKHSDIIKELFYPDFDSTKNVKVY
jgi:hypothetical protein